MHSIRSLWANAPKQETFPPWLSVSTETNQISFIIRPVQNSAHRIFTDEDFKLLIKQIIVYRPNSIVFEYFVLDSTKLDVNLTTLLNFNFIHILDFGGTPKSFFSQILGQEAFNIVAKKLINSEYITGLRLSYFDTDTLNLDAINAMLEKNKSIQLLMLKFKDNYKILRTVLQFNTSIEQLHLVEPPPILDGYTSPIALDFKALAKHFKIPLAKNSKLKEIYFSQGAVFIHAAGVKIARNSAQPPRPPVLSSPLL